MKLVISAIIPPNDVISIWDTETGLYLLETGGPNPNQSTHTDFRDAFTSFDELVFAAIESNDYSLDDDGN